MSRIRTLIVDDEPLARRRLRSLLKDEAELEVIGDAGSGPAAVEAIEREKPELVFLDVQMPGFDGFEVVRQIDEARRPLIVFVTAFDEHAIKAFDVQAVDYVLKPVVEPRFRAAVQRAIGRLRDTPPAQIARDLQKLLDAIAAPKEQLDRLPIKHDGRVTFVPLSDIEWVDADGDFVRVHAGRETHTVRDTMAEMEAKLPAPRFVRVHRSAIVNTERIKEIQPWFKGDYVVLMKDGAKIRTGRTYREAVQRLMR